MKSTLSSVLMWLVAVLIALALAFASPNEVSITGLLPELAAGTELHKPVVADCGTVMARNDHESLFL